MTPLEDIAGLCERLKAHVDAPDGLSWDTEKNRDRYFVRVECALLTEAASLLLRLQEQLASRGAEQAARDTALRPGDAGVAGGIGELLRDLHHSFVGIIRDKVSAHHFPEEPSGPVPLSGEDDAAEAIINAILYRLETAPAKPLTTDAGLAGEWRAWLIEWPADRQMPVRYWHPTEGHVIDPNHAVRFSRQEDAAAVCKRDHLFGGARPVEHMWVAP